jgi:hypothetical protein
MLLLLASLSWASSSDWKPRYLSGLSLFQSYKKNINLDTVTVNYDFYYQDVIINPPYKQEKVDLLIRESFSLSIKKMQSLGVARSDCKQGLKVNIIQIDGNTLNDDTRFGSWRSINGSRLRTMYGIYDPTPESDDNSVLLFSLAAPSSDGVLVHEMAHYWYDRFCVYNNSSIKTEEFAKSVESAYLLGGL